jgi:hypothetical protein
MFSFSEPEPCGSAVAVVACASNGTAALIEIRGLCARIETHTIWSFAHALMVACARAALTAAVSVPMS